MTTIVWPERFPQRPLLSSLTATIDRSVVAFKPDLGPAITRRNSTAPVKRYAMRLPAMTPNEVEAFECFFHDDLAGGSLPFNWCDPITGAPKVVKFAATDQPYTIAAAGGAPLYEISFQLVILP